MRLITIYLQLPTFRAYKYSSREWIEWWLVREVIKNTLMSGHMLFYGLGSLNEFEWIDFLGIGYGRLGKFSFDIRS